MMICNNCDSDSDVIWTSKGEVVSCMNCIRETIKPILDARPSFFDMVIKQYVTENYVKYLQYLLDFRPELIRETLLGNTIALNNQKEFAMLPNGLPEMEFADWFMVTFNNCKREKNYETV